MPDDPIIAEEQTPDAGVPGTMFNPQGGLPITSPFGWRESTNSDHGGVDFQNNPGGDIYAAWDGVVKDIYYEPKGGFGIIIEHTLADGTKFQTKYLHLGSKSIPGGAYEQVGFKVREGQVVKAGDVLGPVGDSGNASAPHLHFSVIGPSGNVDPELFVMSTELGQVSLPTDNDNWLEITSGDGGGSDGSGTNPPPDGTNQARIGGGYQLYKVGNDYLVMYSVTPLGGEGPQYWSGYRLTQAEAENYVANHGLAPLQTAKVVNPNQLDSIFGANNYSITGVTKPPTWTGQEYASYTEWLREQMAITAGYARSMLEVDEIFDLYAKAVVQGWSAEQLRAAIEQTEWWQGQTSVGREWANATDTEREAILEGFSGRLQDVWRQAWGVRPDIDDEELYNLSLQVASGEITYQRAVNTIWRNAEGEAGTPAATELAKATGGREVSIEDRMGELRDISRRWGIQLGNGALKRWATMIEDYEKSNEDFLTLMKKQAEGLYGSVELGTSKRSRETEVVDYAGHYMQAYADLMESDYNADLIFNRHLQEALQSDEKLADFKKRLRGTNEWMDTENARDTFATELARVGQMMGFA